MTEPDAVQTPLGEDRFAADLVGITKVPAHTSRVAPAMAYCTRLLMPGDRKITEPWQPSGVFSR